MTHKEEKIPRGAFLLDVLHIRKTDSPYTGHAGVRTLQTTVPLLLHNMSTTWQFQDADREDGLGMKHCEI
jgi:hypothetical protein